MTRRSALLALLLAPFAWLLRRWRRPERKLTPDGYHRLDTPVLFERGVPIGCVTEPAHLELYESIDQDEYLRGRREFAVITYHPRLPRWDEEPVNDAPFSRFLAGEVQTPTWKFIDGKVDWKVLPIRGRS